MWTVAALALRNLLRHRRRTIITMMALIVGVAIVQFLSGFRNAFIQLIIEDAVYSQAGALQVHLHGYMDALAASPVDMNFPADATTEGKLRAIPGVTAVTARIRFAGLVSGGGTSSMFMGVAVDPVREYEVCPLFKDRAVDADGKPLAPIGPAREDGILMGKELADGLKVKIGDNVTLLVQTPAGGMNALDATIIAFTLPTDPFASKKGLFVSLPFARRLLNMEGRTTELVAAVSNIDAVPGIMEAAGAALGDKYEIHDWETVVPFVREAIVRMAFVLGIVSTVLLLIVITGVMNTVLMSVYERVREVGTMMAIGMTRVKILALFLMEALGIAVMGSLAGLGLGLLIVAWLSARGIPISPPGGGMTAQLHPWVYPSFMLATVAVTVVATMLAALYPAFKASRLRPVEALRAV